MSDIPLPAERRADAGAPLPLHIFEDRYKQMVNECLEQESEFGMVLADESGRGAWAARPGSSSSSSATRTGGC